MDTTKEVESALEEEGYVKIDSTSPSTMTTATITSPLVSSADQTSSLSGGSSPHSQPVSRITSPVQQQIRPDVSSSDASSVSAGKNSNETSSTSLSTWQGEKPCQTSVDDQLGGVWGWMSSAVSAGLQTTHNIGRNIVEKTKVFLKNVNFFVQIQLFLNA